MATFVYTYINANITSIFLRLNTRLDHYRTRLKSIDKFLLKNRVSRELRRMVKRHMVHSFDHDADAAILEQLPLSLRREVLRASHAALNRRTRPTRLSRLPDVHSHLHQ